MMKVTAGLLVALVGLALGGGCRTPSAMPGDSAGGLLLARNGRVFQPVVVASNAAALTRAAAAELASFLGRITGAGFRVVTGDGSTGIVIGAWTDFPNIADSIPRPAQGAALAAREAFIIRTESRRVFLLGATDLGAQHAAFRLLDELGCRWFFPAPEWEVIPRSKTLRVKVNVTDQPAMPARGIWFSWGLFDSRAAADFEAWRRHNLQGGSLAVAAGHADEEIMGWNQAVLARHPEYLALVGNVRRGPHFCYSNPGLRAMLADYAVRYFQRNPGADMVSLEPGDGSDHCQCADCSRSGSVSERLFTAINEAARAVAKAYPGKMVGLLSYNLHSEPPSFNLESNVYVQLAAGYNRGRYSFEERMRLWPQRAALLGYYEYFSVWLWHFDQLPGGRGGDVGYLRRWIPRYIREGRGTSLSAESENNWGPNGRGYYLAARLMWNPGADADAVLADFYQKAFGPAASAMQRYYELTTSVPNRQALSPALLAEAFARVAEADRLSRGHPEVQARLDHIKIYLHYVRLRWQFDHAAGLAEQKPIVLALFTHTYRSRYTYMNHWCVIRDYWSHRARQTYAEPDWSSVAGRRSPWQIDEPYPRQEIDRLFKDDQRYFLDISL